jgi:hypothetical protein
MVSLHVAELQRPKPVPEGHPVSSSGGCMSFHVEPRFDVDHAPGPATQQCATPKHRTVVRLFDGAVSRVQVAPPLVVEITVLTPCGVESAPTAMHDVEDATSVHAIDPMMAVLGTVCSVQLCPAFCVTNITGCFVPMVPPAKQI